MKIRGVNKTDMIIYQYLLPECRAKKNHRTKGERERAREKKTKHVYPTEIPKKKV